MTIILWPMKGLFIHDDNIHDDNIHDHYTTLPEGGFVRITQR